MSFVHDDHAPGDSDGPRYSVSTLVDEKLHSVLDGQFSRALTTCDDGTTYWLRAYHLDDLVTVKMTPNREGTEQTKLGVSSTSSWRNGKFNCADGSLSLITEEKDASPKRRLIENATTNPVETTQDEIPDLTNDDGIYSNGHTPAGYVRVNRDNGRWQKIPMGIGQPVTEGQLNLNGRKIRSVTFDNNEVTLVLSDPSGGDLEIAIYAVDNLQSSSHQLTVKNSAKQPRLPNDITFDLNSQRSANAVYRLAP